jgi:hypothetical protein
MEVAQDPLKDGQVGLPRGVHMQAHMLEGVGDVGSREGEVLECRHVWSRACSRT